MEILNTIAPKPRRRMIRIIAWLHSAITDVQFNFHQCGHHPRGGPFVGFQINFSIKVIQI
jgi:hypothetical protein